MKVSKSALDSSVTRPSWVSATMAAFSRSGWASGTQPMAFRWPKASRTLGVEARGDQRSHGAAWAIVGAEGCRWSPSLGHRTDYRCSGERVKGQPLDFIRSAQIFDDLPVPDPVIV